MIGFQPFSSAGTTGLVASMPTKNHRRRGIEDTLFRVILRGLPKEDEIHRLLAVVTEAADAFERNSPKD